MDGILGLFFSGVVFYFAYRGVKSAFAEKTKPSPRSRGAELVRPAQPPTIDCGRLIGRPVPQEELSKRRR